ncbi:hypothetical protein RBB50_012663 [Rhinocladiella similis]
MSDQTFLFIHKDAGSKSLSRSYDEEHRNVHRHVRLNRPAPTSKVRRVANVGKKVRLVPKTSVSVLEVAPGLTAAALAVDEDGKAEEQPKGRRHDLPSSAAQTRQRRPIGATLSKDQSKSRSRSESTTTHTTHSIIQGNATDPFSTSSVPIDKDIHHLLQYFLNVSHPRNWHAEARAYKGEYRFRHFARGRIVNCLKNASSMYALLASSASQMHYFEGLTPPTNPSVLIGKALHATRKRLSQTNISTTASVVDIDLIFDVHALANADFFRFDRHAARIHVRVVAQLIDQLGGLSVLDRAWREWFIFGDEFIAAEVFEKPFLPPSTCDPGALREAGFDSHSSSQRVSEATILDYTESFVNSPALRALAIDIIEVAEEMQWQARISQTDKAKLPQERVRWRHLRAAALRSRLLNLDSADENEEVTRLALLTWMYMVTTVVGRRRTMKVLASRLHLILTARFRSSGSGSVAWNSDGFLLWALLTGACASEGDWRLRKWFWNVTSSLYSLMSKGEELTASVAFSLLGQFLYFPDVQRPMMEEWTRENHALLDVVDASNTI